MYQQMQDHIEFNDFMLKLNNKHVLKNLLCFPT